MTTNFTYPSKVAILDLYNGAANMGMKNIQNILAEENMRFEIFDVRGKNEIPNGSHDIYISTGGPGSPFDGEGKEWEKNYFNFIEKLWNHNQKNEKKKFVFFICHSFQMMMRMFHLAEVHKRRTMSFGVFPVHITESGDNDVVLGHLPSPFMVADFRHYQVTHPNKQKIEELNGSILALEKIRPHVNYERAIMAMRISPEFIGTQFHPEASPADMREYYAHPEKRLEVIKQHGAKKYDYIMESLKDTDADSILSTYKHVLPTFLRQAKQNVLETEMDLV